MADRKLESESSALRSNRRSYASKEEERASRAAEGDVVDRVTCRTGDDSSATAHALTLNRATDSHPARASHSLLRLQKLYGNRYVERVLARVREDSAHNDVPTDIERAIDQKRGGGQGLDSGVQRQMEGTFGASFGGVRVHAAPDTDALTSSLSARAFATGRDIFFRQGACEPGNSSGRELIAHELTHVVQQGRNRVPARRLQRTISVPAAPEGDVMDGYKEEAEDLVDNDAGAPDIDLPAQNVGDSTAAANVNPGGNLTAPAPRFLDLGRVGTARYGDPAIPHYHLMPQAFTDGGQTATVAWAGGGGAGARGNQNAGSLQTNIVPVFYQTSPKADAFIREGTGKIDVTRSWTGVNAGDQGNGFFLTAAAATRINSHETLHVANSQGHYNADIDPLLTRVSNFTMDVDVAKALLPPSSPRSIPALKAIIKWPASVTHFQTTDTADNKAGGTVDTNDLASGTYPVDAGPGTVNGTAFNHRVRTPGEANPPP